MLVLEVIPTEARGAIFNEILQTGEGKWRPLFTIESVDIKVEDCFPWKLLHTIKIELGRREDLKKYEIG